MRLCITFCDFIQYASIILYMSLIKGRKNIFLSLGSYIIAFAWYFSWLYLGPILALLPQPPTTANILNMLVISPALILIILGIFFGYRSIKLKESLLVGNFLVVVGFITLFFYLFLRAGLMI